MGKEQIGNKAHNLMVMSSLGLPIPNGFVIPIDESIDSWEILELYKDEIAFPVSVRSGSTISMPGMMDTILNVGISRDNLESFIPKLGSKATVLDCHRRLIHMWSTSVKGIDDKAFLEYDRAARIFYFEMNEDAYSKLVDLYEKLYLKETGEEFPSDPYQQLSQAAEAVKDSWNSERAVQYRDSEGIGHDGGTAVIIQEMVFGNMNERSGTGVVFSHNPNNGNPGLYGDFLPMAQGEDIVSGSCVPLSINSMLDDMKFKRCGKELKAYISRLIREFKTIQDIEFTIQDGKLFILQCRQAKCSPRAMIRSALSMVNNGAMNVSQATDMVVESLPFEPTKRIQIDDQNMNRVGFGQGVSDGVAIGYIATTHEYATMLRNENQPYIFCADLTSPNDNEIMRHSVGVLTSMGGRLSHAAILARYMNKVTVVGLTSMTVRSDGIVIDEVKLDNGECIKIDGNNGAVFI